MAITPQQFATEDFFTLVGLADISDEDKQEILESMSKTVHARVYSNIYAELDEQEQEEMNSTPTTKLIPFLRAKGFDLEEMIVEEALKYRLELATMFDLAVHPNQAAAAAA